MMFHLVEAKEVLDGGGSVEDVTFSCHHQHEAMQRLKTKGKKVTQGFTPFTRSFHRTTNTCEPTCRSRSPSEKLTPSMEVTCEEEAEAEAVEEGGTVFWTFPPNIRLRSLVQLEPFWPFFMVAGGGQR